jgi:hypothetical protein
MNTKPDTLGYSYPPCSEIMGQQPAKEEYFSYLMFFTALEQVLVIWFFPPSRFFHLFHLCCIASLSHSLSSHGFSHQCNSLALFFFKHSRHGTCSWCRLVFFLERVVVVAITALTVYGEGVWTPSSMALATSVFPLVTLLLQHSKVVHSAGYAAVAGKFFRRGRRQEHATCFGKSAPFSLSLLHLYPS